MEAAMNRQRRLKALGALPGAVSSLFLLSGVVFGSDQGKLSEEFHQVYPLSARGGISLENINGPVHITAWDRNEVKVDAVKRAWTKERLDEARIEIKASTDSLSIQTRYPERNHEFNDDRHDNPASVEYTLTVPRQARLEDINLVNGSLDVQGL